MVSGTLFLNGRIHTLDAVQPHVESLASSHGRVVARGRSADLLEAFPGFERIDLGGRTALPGFIDAHIHLPSYGVSLRRVELRDARSLREAVEKVRAATEQIRRGEWLRGRGWDKNLWPEDRFPTREDLDPAAPASPVLLSSKDGHLLWVNSAALRLAGIDRTTPDPPGGEIVRDRRGDPTGILKEMAKDLIWRSVPVEGPEEIEEGIRTAVTAMHRLGITSVHSFVGTASLEGAPALRAFQRLHARGELPLRVWATIPASTLESAVATGLRTGFGDEWLRVGPVKIFADGTLGSQTAAMLEPFEGQPGNTGIAVHTREELTDLVRRAVDGGFWCAIHAIGDRANRWVLDAFEASLPATRALGARHRIEHVQLIHPDDLPRLSRLGVIASMQPIHATVDREIADRYWGRRSRTAYAWRSLLRAGTALAFGSDAPVETPDVFAGLYAAVTRKRAEEPQVPSWYPEEALEIDEAVRAYTTGAAYAAGQEGVQGRLVEGSYADFIAVDRDLFAANPEELLRACVMMTVVGGTLVYSA
ncbi:MAG: amidohydrolase [bacterium]